MNGETILLLDDDEPIRKALSARLRHAGYNLVMASDAFTASSLVREHDPSLMLIDINLPGADGFQFAELIDKKHTRFIPRMFITASRAPNIAEKAKQAKAYGLYEKPFASNELMADIQDLLASLENSEANQELTTEV